MPTSHISRPSPFRPAKAQTQPDMNMLKTKSAFLFLAFLSNCSDGNFKGSPTQIKPSATVSQPSVKPSSTISLNSKTTASSSPSPVIVSQIIPSTTPQPTPSIVTGVIDANRTQANDHQIIFGDNSIFHIGDGDFSPFSDCASSVDRFDLSGTVFKFNFDLTSEDNIDISINTICGLDRSDNTITLANRINGLVIKSVALKFGSSSFNTSIEGLKPGAYVLQVASSKGESRFGRKADYEDFVVGGVQIKSNSGKIIIRDVLAE